METKKSARIRFCEFALEDARRLLTKASDETEKEIFQRWVEHSEKMLREQEARTAKYSRKKK